ncbi:Na+/H+ antiporter NhaC family protein [Kistimonas asteriae]|uniref:Na+/H+ antiporter NhaC family protein n=1 Tax=Kistimonas asteriae TaxID=517724 RepID=UPI001BAE3F94|nr:Na+/H+ antiporter NhaC family protein [Kistimonas asteriae]
MADLGVSSVLPPLLSITLAITSRQVYLSLIAGIWFGHTILLDGALFNGLAHSLDAVIQVFQSPDDTRVIFYTFVIGGLIAILEATGGVCGFINWLERRRWANNRRRAQWLAWFIGIVIFIEANLTILVAGIVSRPLFDRFRLSREKLAYLIDATSAPVCMLIPLNGWGAFNLVLLGNMGVADPLSVLLYAIPLNLYAIFSLILSAGVIRFDWNMGAMKAAEQRAAGGRVLAPGRIPLIDQSLFTFEENASLKPSAISMLLPVAVMLVAMPLGLWITGQGDFLKGSGSASVLSAALAAVMLACLLALLNRQLSLTELTSVFMKGASGMMPLALILLLALALGNATQALQTGQYVAGKMGHDFPVALLLPLLFLFSAMIGFSVGSSWGTFAIMMPIAVPLAQAVSAPLAPFIAAVLSGGVFGDHASPISDTTIVASMASATDHIDHVRTQLPYALVSAGLSLFGFGVMGFMV